MAGKTLDLDDLITKDQLGCRIAEQWYDWNSRRQTWIAEKAEIRKYVYATDTTKTTNSKLPWNNKTTIPKLCQIRDNLYANYMASMFPKRRWLIWEGATRQDQDKKKVSAIRDYMSWVIDQPWFKEEVSKLVYDFIDYGNVFATVEWKDDRVQLDEKTQIGYVGPVIRRISPMDIVFNPIAPSFVETPKIVRSLVTLGEAKAILEQLTKTEEDKALAEDLWTYMNDLRHNTSNARGNIQYKDEFFNVDGFDNYTGYLGSNYVEILTFYGDMYDDEKGELLKNHMIVVVDRHRIAYKGPHPSFFGRPPLYHTGWRVRQDNLWAMGPLDNLVGMQYRVDHIENMKADIFDLTVFPPLKIKGYVEDFEWGPFEKIVVGEEGDVEIMSPDVNVLQANIEIEALQNKMEEMAGAPKEAMGFRTPGEKTMYEVQRLENAASRVFQSKITLFEEQILEPLMNAMLELAARHMPPTQVRTIDDEFGHTIFRDLTPSDLAGQGRIRPVAARHFVEKSELVQNLNNFVSSPLWADQGVRVHFSGVKMAQLFEELFNIEDYKIVEPFIAMTEQADAQRLMNTNMEETQAEAMTPAGVSQGDF
jgi:hypothetical protein